VAQFVNLVDKPSALECNWATLFLGGNKYGNMILQVGGVSNIDSIKYVQVKTADPTEAPLIIN
jgi:hypothetical protein